MEFRSSMIIVVNISDKVQNSYEWNDQLLNSYFQFSKYVLQFIVDTFSLYMSISAFQIVFEPDNIIFQHYILIFDWYVKLMLVLVCRSWQVRIGT